jgi:cysteine synthase A
MKIAENITQLIGNTPMIKLNHASKECGANILAKCEFMNPTSSIKDRIATNMIEDAMSKGLISKDTTVIEPTSGNTGIALASVCASLGIKLILTMPESMSIERRKILKAFGARLELTDASKGMVGTLQKAKELNQSIPNSIILQQFSNPANPQIHRSTTAQEILNDCDKKIDIFISSIGTGGTITGVGEILKKEIPGVKIIAVEPENSAVLSGESAGSHKIQGIGAGFIPEVLNSDIYDEIVKVSDEDAFTTARELAKNEGLLVGISSGSNVFAAKEMAKKYPGKNIVTLLCDTGERYLSSDLFES